MAPRGVLDRYSSEMTRGEAGQSVGSTAGGGANARSWVVAAIGLQILLSSMSAAATNCGGVIERARIARLTAPVAQAMRELAEHRVSSEPMVVEPACGAVTREALAPARGRMSAGIELAVWLCDLPPPC